MDLLRDFDIVEPSETDSLLGFDLIERAELPSDNDRRVKNEDNDPFRDFDIVESSPQRQKRKCKKKQDYDELKDFDIIEDALDRKGWVGTANDAELSIRLYDPNLKQNIDASTEYEASPFGGEDDYFYEA